MTLEHRGHAEFIRTEQKLRNDNNKPAKSGKSGIAVLLSEQLQEMGIQNLVISGDNYPRLIPEKTMPEENIFIICMVGRGWQITFADRKK